MKTIESIPLRRRSAPDRVRAIREELGISSSISITEMAARLGVSEMTIRRDLVRMEENADVKRTHGGAVLAERMAFEFNYKARQKANLREKQAIAAAARKLVKPGERVIIDTGTTAFQLAILLKDCEGCTIITPSLAVASELQFCENLNVILLGGVIHRGSPDLTGPVTEHGLELFSVDWVFQGTEGIGSDGTVYNVDLQLGRVDRKMREKSARSCLLADSSKFGQTALVKTGSLSDFDLVITDESLAPPFVRLARKLAPEVILA